MIIAQRTSLFTAQTTAKQRSETCRKNRVSTQITISKRCFTVIIHSVLSRYTVCVMLTSAWLSVLAKASLACQKTEKTGKDQPLAVKKACCFIADIRQRHRELLRDNALLCRGKVQLFACPCSPDDVQSRWQQRQLRLKICPLRGLPAVPIADQQG